MSIPNFGRPVRNFKGGAKVVSSWGSPRLYRHGVHRGFDFPGTVGDPIYAVADGVVTYSQLVGGGDHAGLMTVVQHEGGFFSRYLHQDKSLVTKGQLVKRGDHIGNIGRSGIASKGTGTHLHFDMRATPEAIESYKAKFGTPADGFPNRKLSGGVDIPSEPLIPVDEYSDSVVKMAAKFNVPLRGTKNLPSEGMNPVIILALAGVGYYLLR